MYRAELIALFGQPVDENPTGLMQEAGFRAAGVNFRYLNIEVAPERLGEAVAAARTLGFRGLNLTIPHKVAVIPFLDELSDAARMIGAVNTVVFREGRAIGENTDGKGFLRALTQDAGFDPRGKRVMLLGAGGAARAIAAELLLAGAADIGLVNRSADRAQRMAQDLKLNIVPAPVVDASVDLLINATPLGLFPDVASRPDADWTQARRDLLVADAVFNPAETRLLREAKQAGFRTLDGLSMLAYQGVIGFELWTGAKAPEAIMKEALRATLVG